MQWRMRLENEVTRYTFLFGNGFTKKAISFVACYLL